jgi:hypothetical protein
VEEMLPQVLQRWKRVFQEAALCGKPISKLSHVTITARSKAKEKGFV